MSTLETLGTLGMYVRRTRRLRTPTDLYAHTVTLLDGGKLDLVTFRGRPTLIVNTASRCGFTPQYRGLEALYQRYHPQGLEMLGTPSGDFAGQELEQADAISAFCRENYGVSFPLSERMSVRRSPGPLWRELISQPTSAAPAWNFSKYLIGVDGHLIGYWGPRVVPEDPRITTAIELALADVGSPDRQPGG